MPIPKELFAQSLKGIELNDKELMELSDLTGPENNSGLGHSFSDIRLKILPEAIAFSFPDKKLTFETLRETIKKIKPSPEIK